MRRARRQLMQAIQLLVDPLERSGKDLLALSRQLGRARKAPSARLGLAFHLALLLPGQYSSLVAMVLQAQLDGA
jgi:hypothetical protein